MSYNAYTPVPPNVTKSISASTSSAQTYVDLTTQAAGIVNLLFTNTDAANTVFVTTSTTSTATATTSGFPVPPYYPTVIQVASPNTYVGNVTVAAITASGTASIYITPIA
jgi:hypothetical protein